MFVYLFCVIPVCIWDILFSVNEHATGDNMAVSGILLYCLYWLQYGINWIFYFFNNPRYRRAFKQLISCMLRKKLKPIRHYPHKIRISRRINLSNRIFIVSDKVPSISGIHGIESSSHSHAHVKLHRTVKFDICNNHHPIGTMFYDCESSSSSLDSALSDYTETTNCTETTICTDTDSYIETTSFNSESHFHFSMIFRYSEENISKSMYSDDNIECFCSQSISTAGNHRRRHSSSICGHGNINSCKVLSRKCSL